MTVTFSPGSTKSTFFVLIQFACVGYIAFTGVVLPENKYYLILIIISLLLAVWSMAVMKFHFNAAPDILPNVTLKTKGPYKLIRHPMYTSLLMLVLIWIINDFSLIRIIVYIILIIDLLIKLHFEEIYLIEKFPEYKEYRRHTKRIIPYIL